ncbi:MAG: DUF2231 domain-containing protein [Kofleriaceae bacterium]
MLTKARIAGHPIHPMLIAFPVAFYTATAVTLIVFGATADTFWFRAAFWANLAGIVMAAIAAIPGAIDLFTLPHHTSARRTGYSHAVLNVSALVLFVISFVLIARSWYGGSLDYTAPLVLSLCGIAITVGAGALGWTLVQTHHVGVIPTAQVHTDEPVEKVADLDAIFPQVARPSDAAHLRH